MKVIKSIAEMRAWSDAARKTGRRIGFVPTMGFLHEGHLSLIRLARAKSDLCVVSIFVNPTQFGPHEDLDKYPRDLERDLELCRAEGADVVFFPDTNEMYAPPYQTFVKNETLSDKLCGQSRPIHFRGVTTVVSKLFNIVDPDVAAFGQKDAQQAIIIKNMVRDLNFRTEILIGPIVREPDGLAMSSRNKYLSPDERMQALALSQTLKELQKAVKGGNRDYKALAARAQTRIDQLPACRTDYIAFVDTRTLEPATAQTNPVLIAIAVFVGPTRLIDNVFIKF